MRILIVFCVSFFFFEVSVAVTSGSKWMSLSDEEKFSYLIGYIDGQLAMNKTVKDKSSPNSGVVHIPDASEVLETISNMDLFYSDSNTHELMWFELMPLATSKAKWGGNDHEAAIRGLINMKKSHNQANQSGTR